MVQEAAGERVEVVSSPFKLPFLSRGHKLEEQRKDAFPVHRPSLKGASTLASIGALPFALQGSILRGTEFAVERWRGKRDIYNLAMAGGLSFGALHLFSLENLIALSKKQARFQGRFLLMAVGGVAVGSFGHAAELAFYDISIIFQKHVLVSESLPKDRSLVSSDNAAKMRSLDIDDVEESNW